MSEDREQKAIESMADAMLGGFTESPKVEEKPRPTTQYYRGRSVVSERAANRPLDDDLDALDEAFGKGTGSSRTTSQTPPTLHTTSKEGTSPYQPRYGTGRVVSQGGNKTEAFQASPLRQSLKKLSAQDVDGLDLGALNKRVKDALLDEFERQGWLLLGAAEAHMFSAAVDNNVKAAIRAVAMKIAINDIMRNKNKPKPAA